MIRFAILALAGLFLFAGGSAAEVKGPPVYDLDVSAIPGFKIALPNRCLKPKPFTFGSGEKGWVVRVAFAQQVPTGIPTPGIASGRVIVSGGLAETRMFGLDAETGKKAWATSLSDNGPSAVAVRGRTVAVNTESCTTYVLDAVTGKRSWARWVGANVMAAPAISGNRVYAAHASSEGHSLSALDIRNGKILWSRKLASDIHGAPVCAGGKIYVAEAGGRLRGFDAKGTSVLTERVGAASAPWATSDGLYVTTRTGYGFGLSRIDPGKGDIAWSRPVRETFVTGRTVSSPSKSTAKRRVAIAYTGWSSDPPRPVVIGDAAMLANGRDLLVCDARNGRVKYRARLPVGCSFHAPPAVLGDRLLFGTLDGLLVEVDTKVGAVRRAFDVGHPIQTQPVVAKGRAYVVANGCVFCIPWGKADGPEWPQWGGTGARSAN